MRYSLVSILFLTGRMTCHGVKGKDPECWTKCVESTLQASEDTSLADVCHDLAKQRNVFTCIGRTCESQYYGLALSQAIVSCTNLGADIATLYPIQVNDAGSSSSSPVWQRRQSLMDKDTDVLSTVFAANGFSLSVACQAGSDGVITIEPPSASPLSPNLADLPGGHRGPTTPEGSPELQPAMTLTTEGQFSSGVCHTCSISSPSGSSFLSDSMIGTLASDSGPNTPSQSGLKESGDFTPSMTGMTAHNTADVGTSGCTSTTSNPKVLESSSSCGCPTTTTTPSLANTPCSTTATSTRTPSIPTSTPCTSTAEIASTSTLFSVSVQATTEEKGLNISTSCESSASQTHVLPSTLSNTTLLETKSISPTADVHFPKKPSDTPCSFTNSTVSTVSKTSLTTISVAELTTATPSSSCSSTVSSTSTSCTTSELSSSAALMHTSTIPSKTSTSTPSFKPTEQLQEYTTTSTPRLAGYTSASTASLYVYDEPPPYSFSVAIVSSIPTTSSSPSSEVTRTSTIRKVSSTPGQTSLPSYETTDGASKQPASSMTAEVISTTTSSSPVTSFSHTSASVSLTTRAVSEGRLSDVSSSTTKTIGTTSEPTKRSQESSYETPMATKQSHPPSAMFVTIITADDAGDLQTSVMTVKEQSPWASLVPRLIPEHDTSHVWNISTVAPSTSFKPHMPKTATMNSTLFVTVTETASGTATDNSADFRTSDGTSKSRNVILFALSSLVSLAWGF